MTTEVGRLAAVASAFCKRELGALRRMVEINSFTSNAEGVNEVGKFTAAWFQSAIDQNFQPNFYPSKYAPRYGNHVTLSLQPETHQLQAQEDSRPTVALVSHLDTVYSAAVEEEHDFVWTMSQSKDPPASWIVGPGTMDIKGGTFMIGAVLHTLKMVRPDIFVKVDFQVLLNASEEVMANDFVDICQKSLRGRHKSEGSNCLGCLVFEAGKFDGDFLHPTTNHDTNSADVMEADNRVHEFTLVTSRKGMCVWAVEITGHAAHAGNAHQRGKVYGFIVVVHCYVRHHCAEAYGNNNDRCKRFAGGV